MDCSEIDSAEDAAIVAHVLAARPQTNAIYRYGSTVTGYARPDSDIDVAILAEQPLAFDDRMALAGAVAAAAGREADIMDLLQASQVAQQQAIIGRKLYERDPLLVGKFECRVLREGQDFRVRRKPLEEQLLADGWPHA